MGAVGGLLGRGMVRGLPVGLWSSVWGRGLCKGTETGCGGLVLSCG